MARVRYVGPSEAVYILVLDEGREFKRGKVEEVPDAIAGRAPEPRLAVAMAELEVARIGGDHQWQRDLRAEIAGLDYGEGLLAQSIWESAEPKQKSAKEDDK